MNVNPIFESLAFVLELAQGRTIRMPLLGDVNARGGAFITPPTVAKAIIDGCESGF